MFALKVCGDGLSTATIVEIYHDWRTLSSQDWHQDRPSNGCVFDSRKQGS